MTMQTPGIKVIRDAVELACRAPSVHNSQPWRWVVDGSTLHLFADVGRLMSAADPLGREIILSCDGGFESCATANCNHVFKCMLRRIAQM